MTNSDRSLRKLVLAFESLEGDERRRAKETLAADVGLGNLLHELQVIERKAAWNLPLDGTWPDTVLTAVEEMAERASYVELLAVVERSHPLVRNEKGGRSHRFFRASLLLPIAAVLAMALLLPRGLADRSFIRNPGVVSMGHSSDGARGFHAIEDAGVLRSGERFQLTFSLAADAHVLVVHIGPDGDVDVVYPNDLDQPLPRLPGGVPQAVPDRDATRSWVLDRTPGVESFIVVAGDTDRVDGDAFLARLTAATEGLDDRALRIATLLEVLAETGATQVIEFQHRD